MNTIDRNIKATTNKNAEGTLGSFILETPIKTKANESKIDMIAKMMASMGV